MNEAQFRALAELAGMRLPGPTEACRLVLVDGMRPAEAARATGLAPAAVSNALARCRRALALAQEATAAPQAI